MKFKSIFIMDKIKVNNQVILMRKVVKQAKLYTINKLTKGIKIYQTKKGTVDQKEKYERKTKRLLEKIIILKKIKPDSVSRMALSKAKDWNAILAQKDASLEEQCLAVLANCSEVQKEVEKFCASENHLVPKIPELIQEWEIKSQNPNNKSAKTLKASDIKRKKMEKISKRKKSQFKGASFPNNVKIASKSFPGNDEKNMTLPLETKTSDDENLSKASDSENDVLKEVVTENFENKFKEKVLEKPKTSSKSHNIDISALEIPQVNSSVSKNPKNKNKKKLLPKAAREQVNLDKNSNKSSDSDNNQSIFKKLSAIAASDTKKTTKQRVSNDSEYTKAVTVFDLNSLKNSDQIPIESSSLKDSDSHDLTTTHKEDPFFLTDEQNYSDSEDSERSDGQIFTHKSNFRSFKRRKYHNENKRNSFKDNNFYKRKGNFPDIDFSLNKNNYGQNKFKKKTFFSNKHFKQENKRNFEFPANMNKNKAFKPDLQHLKEFKRNNIDKPRFDMNNYRDKFKKDIHKEKKAAQKMSDEDKVNLHPSWEAKRKLKESLKSGAKGKRLIFND